MRIVNVTPGLLPIPPNGWGAIEKIIWEIHNNILILGYESEIKYLNDVNSTDDIVHIHAANLANMAHERGIPYYFTLHDHHAYLYGKNSELYKENLLAMQNAKRAFVPAKYLVEYFDNIPTYFSHGVNTDFFNPNEYENSEIKLLCVANNGYAYNQSIDRKGFSIAIEAAKQLNLPITIAGPINNKMYFESNPSDYTKLTILYDLTEEELRKLYQQHSIFLHTSELEAGHPNLTLLEAMASGLPVIGTYEDSNELEGMIRVNRDCNEVVYAIQYLLKDNNLMTYRNNAIDTANKKSWKTITKKLLSYYNPPNMKDMLIRGYESTTINAKESLPQKPAFTLNFINGAFFEIKGGPDKKYKVEFRNKKTNKVEYENIIGKDHWVKTARQHYVDWDITADDSQTIYRHTINLKDKRVYIALDSKALGDTLAWFPQVDEFRKKHNCKLICSTFHNYLFEESYPEIEFTNPGAVVNNLHAMYTLGWFYNSDGTVDHYKNPIDFKTQPLQKTASDMLGLDYHEVIPKIKMKPNIERENIVSIAIHGTAQSKYWNNQQGWQEVVNYLKGIGYRVILLSKEHDGYMGNMHPTGIEQLPAGPLETVIETLQKSKLFIGIGSGLSWLSWATGTTTCLISGFSEPYSEFETNVIRIASPAGKCSGCFNSHRLDAGDWNWCPIHKGTDRQFECTKSINAEMVIEGIKHVL